MIEPTPQDDLAEKTGRSAKRVHPEDVRVGDDIAIAEETFEFLCPPPDQGDSIDPKVRVSFLPIGNNPPLRVKAICVPLLFCKAPNGEPRLLDARRHQLYRLDPQFARVARKALKKHARRREPSE